MNKKAILKTEVIGFFVITVLGMLLHFCFEWSGNFKPLALFCAVNESVWEHLKIGFWPAFFFALYEYFIFGRNNSNFLFAKAISLFTIPLTIPVIFYLIKAITGQHYLWLDIALFIFTIALSQFVSYKIITSKKDYSKYNIPALILLIILTAAFSLFTYYPPKLELFKDTTTNTYGIQK